MSHDHRAWARAAALTAMLVGLASPAAAETYSVSAGASGPGTGTTADPFDTLQRAADAAQPGDVVLVENGSYAGFVGVRAGTASAPITFRANGDAVVIDRACGGCGGHGIDLRNPDSPRDHIVIEGFAIQGMDQRGINMSWTTGLVIRGCTVTGNGGPNIYGGHTTDVRIEDNEIANGGNHGVYIANSSTGPVIVGNRIHDNATAGIHFNGDVRFPPGDGVIRGAVIERNRIFDNGQNGLNWDGVQDSRVANNFIYGNALNGVRAFGPPNGSADSAEGPRNDVFVNNTILVPASGGWCIRITDDLGGNVAFNNILISESGGGSIALDGTMGFDSGYNVVEGRLSLDRGNTILSLTEWQAAGYGEGSLESERSALFVGVTDLHLRDGAPAIDRGEASFGSHTAPVIDIDGQARPAGAALDVGADEHGDAPTVDAGVPVAVDGGPMGADAGVAVGSDADVARDGGATPTDPPDGGCSCRVGSRSSLPPTAGLVALLLLGLFFRRRRV